VRIVFATHAYAPALGGAERYARGLAEAMATAGHDIHVVTQDRLSAEAFYEYGHSRIGQPKEMLGGVSIHRIPLEAGNPRTLGRTRRDGSIPERVANKMWNRYARSLAEELAELAPAATFALPHAFPNVDAALNAPHHGLGIYAPLLHEEDPAWRAEPIESLVSRATVAVALTTWEAMRLISTYGADPSHTVVAPPGVDAPDIASVTPYQSPLPYVVSVGRRTASKDLPKVTEAVAALRADGLELVHLVAGPPGEADVDRSLRRFGEAVEIVGQVDESTKWSLIKGSVASVSMSTHESFGIAAVESWRMGRPAISRRTPVTEEMIEDGVNGHLVDTVDDLEAALRDLLMRPDHATELGRAGRQASDRFSWESSAGLIIDAIGRSISDE